MLGFLLQSVFYCVDMSFSVGLIDISGFQGLHMSGKCVNLHAWLAYRESFAQHLRSHRQSHLVSAEGTIQDGRVYCNRFVSTVLENLSNVMENY